MTDRPEPLRLGSTAPNFKAETTQGPIDFHEFIGDNWVILFSHPEVCARASPTNRHATMVC